MPAAFSMLITFVMLPEQRHFAFERAGSTTYRYAAC